MVRIEKRNETRLNVSIDVKDSANNNLGEMNNITSVGAFIINSGDLPDIGTILNIKFRIPKTTADICTRAKVMWHSDSPKGIGILFFSMDNKYFTILENFIESLKD